MAYPKRLYGLVPTSWLASKCKIGESLAQHPRTQQQSFQTSLNVNKITKSFKITTFSNFSSEPNLKYKKVLLPVSLNHFFLFHVLKYCAALIWKKKRKTFMYRHFKERKGTDTFIFLLNLRLVQCTRIDLPFYFSKCITTRFPGDVSNKKRQN